MRWTSLGHACWLIEAAGLRLLCDPLVEVEHHGGVFEVWPRRRLRAAALRPDFILISHRHPDHFDIPSLARLAALDPDTVVVTPDGLVAEAATRLGFRTVHLLPPGQRVALDGLTLVTTESVADDEWGVMIGTEAGVVWNMVDTVLRDPDHVRAVTRAGLAALGHGEGRVTLALVQGQPMHEVAAQLGQDLRFPYARYARTLAQLAAIEAGALVPSAAGTVHAPRYAWLNAIVYPVDEARLRRDLARVCPDAALFPATLGARYRIEAGAVIREPALADELYDALPGGEPCVYRPTQVPALRDPTPLSAAGLAQVEAWLGDELGPALVAAHPQFGVEGDPQGSLRFVVELAHAQGTTAWTLDVGPGSAILRPGFEPDWDAYNLAAASLVLEVLDGRRQWGDLLLGGALRGFSRAYTPGPTGLRRANLGELFVYYGLSYDASTRRAVAWELDRAARAHEDRS